MTNWLRPLDESTAKFLPESDALQNASGLLDEFLFGILNGNAGHKRVLPAGECERLRIASLRPSRNSLLEAAQARAIGIKTRLENEPGLTRAAVARELGVSRARITQMLRRFRA